MVSETAKIKRSPSGMVAIRDGHHQRHACTAARTVGTNLVKQGRKVRHHRIPHSIPHSIPHGVLRGAPFAQTIRDPFSYISVILATIGNRETGMIRVLFVCMGNICRSPMAEGVLRAMAATGGLGESLAICSAGTHGYHEGEPPDPRAQEAARAWGTAIGHLRARKVQKDDFEAFDYILAMDRDNHAALKKLCPPERMDRLHLFLSFAENPASQDVPDPYYGGAGHFDAALELIKAGAVGLLAEIRTEIQTEIQTGKKQPRGA